MGAAPLTVGFLFVHTFKRAPGPCVCQCVCVCSAWKGKRMRANWVSQEAGLESDLISLMCDQCEWEAGTQKASVAMQLRPLRAMCWSPETGADTRNWAPSPPGRLISAWAWPFVHTQFRSALLGVILNSNSNKRTCSCFGHKKKRHAKYSNKTFSA